jgi:chromosome segregation ATPase
MFSCAAPQAPQYDQSTIAPKTESVRPDIVVTKENITLALEENKQLKRELDRSETIIKDQVMDIDKALDSSSKMLNDIKKDIAIKENEMVSLIQNINNVKKNNAQLSQQNAILLFDLKSQESSLSAAQENIRKAEDKAIAKENEADDLRVNLEEEMKKNIYLDESNKKLKEFADKNAIKAANAGVYKSWVLYIVGGFILYIILKNVAASVWPQASILRRL